MTRIGTLLLLLALGISPLYMSCGTGTPDTVRTEPQSVREQRIETLLNEYAQRIKVLDAKAHETAESLRQETERSLGDLKKTHEDAVRQLEELRESTNRAWRNKNEQLQVTLDELKKAYDRTRELEK